MKLVNFTGHKAEAREVGAAGTSCSFLLKNIDTNVFFNKIRHAP